MILDIVMPLLLITRNSIGIIYVVLILSFNMTTTTIIITLIIAVASL